MPRGRKKCARVLPEGDVGGGGAKDAQIEKLEDDIADPDVQRQCAAIRALRDVEMERLWTDLDYHRSSYNDEQLQTPVLQHFSENYPNLSVEIDDETGQLDVKWKTDSNPLMDNRGDAHASLLHRLSMARSDFSLPVSSFGGYDFSSQTVKTRRLDVSDMQIRDFVLEEPSETQILGMQEAFQTPGISSSRLSVGMTPKTLRLPKPGEILLSVHGSPLGVFKEENMDAIRESEEG